MSPTPDSGIQARRVYEQPPDAISLYAETAQIVRTGHEVVLQFYETIPGPPTDEGKIQVVRTRLRATITVSLPHANNIGRLLLEQTGATVQPTSKQGEKK